MLRLARWLKLAKTNLLCKRRRPILGVEDLEERVVPTLLGQQLFPADYPWNQNISNAPVAANSAAIIAHIGSSIGIHPDWGEDSPANGNSPLYGIPFNVVHGNTTAKVNVIIDNYPGESDVVPAPVPANAVIEGDFQNGPNLTGGGYNTGQRGDSHLLVWDEDTNTAYEFYGVTRPSDPTIFPDRNGNELPHTDGRWHAAQESVWNMNTNSFRSLGDTSADAAGLSILAGLARPDEGLPAALGGQGAIHHALRFTLPSGDVSPQYIYPASHVVSTSAGSNKLPFGARLRLMNTPAVNQIISTLGPEAQIVARAMQQYGLVLADIGSAMYVSGASAAVDANNQIQFTWDMNDVLGLRALKASAFEVVNLTPQVTGLSVGSGVAGSSITVIGQNFSGAAGHLAVFFGNIPATSITLVDDAHITAVVPNGSGTVDVRVQSGVNATDPNNPGDNVNNPIFGYGISATSPPDQFTFNNYVISPGNSIDSFATSIPSAGTADVLTISVMDTTGKPVAGLAGSAFTLTLSGGTSAGPFGAVTETATKGTYQTTFTGATAGTADTLTVTVSGVVLTPRPTLTVTPAAAALFVLSGFPSQLAAGTSTTFTLTARDLFGNLATGYRGTANFTSSDASAVLPANYTFTAVDAGVHAFTARLLSAGTQSVTATDVASVSLTATQGNIAVFPFPFASAQGVALRAAKGQTFAGKLATFTAVGNQPASSFTATIDWGNGSFSAGAISGLSGGGFAVTGNHAYAASGQFTVRTLIHSQAGTSTTVTAPASVGSADQLFVIQLYGDLLGRATDASGLAVWSGQLDQALATRQQVAAALVGSQEFRTNEVQTLYLSILGRAVDPSGLQNWVTFLGQGGTAVQVEAQLLGSAEFFNKSGGNNATFLAALFMDVLHRQIDPGGASALGQELAGGVARLTVAQQVLASQEACTSAVQGLYQQFLHRSADSAGLQAFVGQLQNGGSAEQITAALAGSLEYAQACSGAANLYYVQNLYTDLLHRPLDPNGQASFVGALDNGQSPRAQVVQAILGSNEYRANVVNSLYQTYLHRPADPSSLTGFIVFLANGGTNEQLAAMLAGSAEFFNDNGGTNAGFVDGLYRGALGRPADAGGLAAWQSVLQSGATRTQVASAIFGSSEYRSDLVQSLYQRFLHRPADNGGLGLFTSALQNGARDEAIIIALAGSVEYFTR
jgi:hypothetical protein